MNTVANLSRLTEEERRLFDTSDIFNAIIEGFSDPVLVVGLDHQVLLINEAASELVQKEAAFCVGRKCHELFHRCSDPCDTTGSACLLDEMRFKKKPLHLKKTHRRQNGDVQHFEIVAIPMLAADGRVSAVIEICRNVTSRVEAEAAVSERDRRLQYLALHDSLTGLRNRTSLLSRLHETVANGLDSGTTFALLFVDLDSFSIVNETLGHRKGDLVLQEVARRLQGAVRDRGIVARLGSDEFGILVEGISGPEGAVAVAEEVGRSVSATMIVGDDRIYVTASIGVALYPRDGGDAEAVLAAAEVAVTRSKLDARGEYRLFTTEMIRAGRNALRVEADLRESLARQDLVVHYQPIIDLCTGTLQGAEALVRWQHHERGLVYPGEFIPVAEQTGLIVPLGEYVLDAVCRDISQWRSRGLAVPVVSINVSPRQFRQANLVEVIESCLREYDVEPRLIDLEVTESTIMTDVESAVRVMRRLKELGFGLTIDDFGTGYSSLAYLRKFPLDKLKIDYGFVADIVTDDNSAAVATAVIALAGSLGLKVVAEGIENEAQFHFLKDRRCDFGQGYLFGRAEAPEEFAERFLPNARPIIAFS